MVRVTEKTKPSFPCATPVTKSFSTRRKQHPDGDLVLGVDEVEVGASARNREREGERVGVSVRSGGGCIGTRNERERGRVHQYAVERERVGASVRSRGGCISTQ